MVPFKVFMVPFKVSSKAGGIASQIPRDTIKTKIMTSMMMWIGLKNVKVLTRQSHTRNVKATLQSRAFSNHYEVSSTYCQLSLHLWPTGHTSMFISTVFWSQFQFNRSTAEQTSVGLFHYNSWTPLIFHG